MTTLRPLDLDTWPRRETFEHYFRRNRCTFAATVDVDVTALVGALPGSGRKTYPSQVWAIATVVNRHPALRMSMSDDGVPGVWDRLDPMFTVLNPERETFCAVRVPYDADFAVFHDAATALLTEHRHATAMFPQGPPPDHTFDISSLPWTSFTGFALQVEHGWEHLRPIWTIGRFRESGGRTLMPLALQIHHAAADGLHAARALADLEQLLAEPGWLA
nr:CatA-like O-acetyltransferase [Xylanimonas cellulosilytica]